MRAFFEGTSKDGNGKVIPSATIAVFLAGTTTPTNIYTTLTGTVAVNSVTSSATTGCFSFYVDRFDYDSDQKFDLYISHASFTPMTYYNVAPEPILGTYVISANRVVTTHLIVPKGVMYSPAIAVTLTLNGIVEAGAYQIFGGLGTVTLGIANTFQRAEWWVPAGTNVIPTHGSHHLFGGTDPMVFGGHGTVTLNINQATTVVADALVEVDSWIAMFPQTANAAVEIGNGTMYISTKTAGVSFTITHANNATANRTFDYLILY